MRDKFEIGDKVRWESHSQGKWTTKTGVVALIVPTLATPAYNSPELLKNYQYGRDHVSYMVRVQIGKRQPRYYWPRVSALRLAK